MVGTQTDLVFDPAPLVRALRLRKIVGEPSGVVWLAKMTGKSIASVSRTLNGITQNPETVGLISSLIGVDPETCWRVRAEVVKQC